MKNKIRPNHEAFQYYFYFMEERMKIFWKRYHEESLPWTKDPTFSKHKFTNVYRASDRVSQFLIRQVIYHPEVKSLGEEDILLRVLMFKIFNKIETWQFLKGEIGTLSLSNFNVDTIVRLLSERQQDKAIFSRAYMMTGSHSNYLAYKSKHEKWLRMVDQEIIRKGILHEIIKAKSLSEIFNLLRNCAFIGDFLAYQYAIDFNYTPVINFSENSFVKAGIGAIRGIKKCFINSGGNSYEDLIRYTQDHLMECQEKYEYTEFINLFGRAPQLIDLQNCFCETDKLLRAKLPELKIDNVRIKQRFIGNPEKINYFFPPKWDINDKIG
jgi:hypothetical protein